MHTFQYHFEMAKPHISLMNGLKGATYKIFIGSFFELIKILSIPRILSQKVAQSALDQRQPRLYK